MILTAYSNVFSMKGKIVPAVVSPPISYVVDRISTVLDCRNATDVLSCARALSDANLLEVLFKAVAGDYTVATGALHQDICNIVTDPITGYLTLNDRTQENRIVLTIIIVILFGIVGFLVLKKSTQQSS